MADMVGHGPVIFTGEKDRLTRFYEAMTGLDVRFADSSVTVLASDSIELVIHALENEPPADDPPSIRADAHVKPFFPVTSPTKARERAVTLGDRLRPR